MPDGCEKDCPQKCENDNSEKCERDPCVETCEEKEPPCDCAEETKEPSSKCEEYTFKPPLYTQPKSNVSKNQPQIKCDRKRNVPKQPLFSHPLRAIGPKQVKILMQFVPSALVYAATSLMLVVYMSDWKTVLQHVPYYNGKYYKEPPEKAEEPEKDED